MRSLVNVASVLPRGLSSTTLLSKVVKNASALEELLDADPVVLENRLSMLLRVDGAVDTPQKLDYIVSAIENRAGGGNGGGGGGRGKGLELSVNRMSDP